MDPRGYVDAAVSRRMSRTRGRDTAPEMALRRELHRRGLRYRVGIRPVAGLRRTGDVVFTRAKVVVCVDGCFWHGCPIHYVEPQTRTEFWRSKIEGNQHRDAETTELWQAAGWLVLRVWEHETTHEVADLVGAAVAARTGSRAAPSQPSGTAGPRPTPRTRRSS